MIQQACGRSVRDERAGASRLTGTIENIDSINWTYDAGPRKLTGWRLATVLSMLAGMST
jgi:hypothetical protein